MAGPVTTYVDFTFTEYAIGQKTDSSGVHTANTDTSAEAARLGAAGVVAGARSATAFQTAATTGMVLAVGSGVSKADKYDVAGTVAGQESYRVRLDQATISVTVPAAEAAVVRTDEIYLVVLDNAYDSSGKALPRIGYRKGATTGGAPGVDASWKASAKLCTITVPAAAVSIVTGNLADARTFADGKTVHDTYDHSAALASAILDDLSDVVLVSLVAGHGIYWNGGAWTNNRVDGVLASTVYNPGGSTTYTVAVGSAADVDATNLAVTFTPLAGITQVWVDLQAFASTFGSGNMWWSLRNGSSDVANSATLMSNAMAYSGRMTTSILVTTGITPGTPTTLKWAAFATGASQQILVGFGPTIMRVRAA